MTRNGVVGMKGVEVKIAGKMRVEGRIEVETSPIR